MRSESICAHTDLYVNVHSRLLCVILKCAKGQSIHQQMNEQNTLAYSIQLDIPTEFIIHSLNIQLVLDIPILFTNKQKKLLTQTLL